MSSKRKPRNYWTLENILKECKRLVEEKRYLPSQKELYGMQLSGLTDAIRRNGGFGKIRQLLGEKSPRKPRYYWEKKKNFEKNLKDVIKQLGHFPTQKELCKLGKSYMATAAINNYGGFVRVRREMGYGTEMKPAGYWQDFRNVERQVKGFWREHPEFRGELPGSDILTKHDYGKLANAISRNWSYVRVRKLLELGKRETMAFYKTKTALKRGLLTLWKKYPSKKRTLPPSNWLRAHGFALLDSAINYYHGGSLDVRNNFGLLSKGKKINKFKKGELATLADWKKLEEKLKNVFDEHPEIENYIPSGTWLNDNGYGGIREAIYKYHGGIVVVRERIGQTSSKRLESFLENYVNENGNDNKKN